jgi:hypothetical protein
MSAFGGKADIGAELMTVVIVWLVAEISGRDAFKL